MIKRAKRWFFSAKGYDATVNNGRRKPPIRTGGKSEDSVLTKEKRDTLIGTTQDVRRNFSIAAWAIRQHLNYVSEFTFQARTENEDLNNEIEAFIASWGNRQNCDVRRKHPLRRMIRLAEAMRVVQGDFGFLKVAGKGSDRGRLQAIEGDRIVSFGKSKDMPEGFEAKEWVNGVKLKSNGTAQAYSIGKRTETHGQLVFDRIVPARSMFMHGFYDRFDQVRGISPVAAALNSFKDLYEGFDFALAKLKVAQLFGLAIYRDAVEAFDGADPTLDSDGDGDADSGYKIDFSDGPQLLDLNPGDRAEFLEAATPAAETVKFLELITQVALKSLDLPMSFFDESHTNFYGSRAGLIQYLHGCRAKIQDLVELLNDITRWRLGMAVVDGDLALPRGLEFDALQWEWIPVGVPWWDPSKEIKGYREAIDAGLDNPQRVCRVSGTDFYENIDAIAKAQQYASDRGVTVNYGAAAAAAANPFVGAGTDE